MRPSSMEPLEIEEKSGGREIPNDGTMMVVCGLRCERLTVFTVCGFICGGMFGFFLTEIVCRWKNGSIPACGVTSGPYKCMSPDTSTWGNNNAKQANALATILGYDCKQAPCNVEDMNMAELELNGAADGKNMPGFQLDVPYNYIPPDGSKSVVAIMPGLGYPEARGLSANGYGGYSIRRMDIDAGYDCPCIGHAQTIKGVSTWCQFTEEGRNDGKPFFIPYPADFGYNCKSWDLYRHPACRGEVEREKGKLPEWCYEPWCYVHPPTCKDPRVDDIQKSSYFNWNEEGGTLEESSLIYHLHYSWKRCGSTAKTSEYEEVQRCLHMGARCDKDPHCKTGDDGKCVPK